MWLTILLWAASFALNLLLTPKPQNAKPSSLADFDAPTAEEGREIPVLFGTRTISGPNVVWYGDFLATPIKGARRYGFFGPRSTTGYHYYLGMHLVLCHGVCDLFKRIRVGEKDLLTGSLTSATFAYMPELFGGEDQEGGIVGWVDLEFGPAGQPANDYLLSVLGPDVPAFRGVVAAILRQMYMGTTAYLKPWDFRVQRITKTSSGATQWYDDKAAVSHNFNVSWYQSSADGSDEARVGVQILDGVGLTPVGIVAWSPWASPDHWVARTLRRGVNPDTAQGFRIFLDFRRHTGNTDCDSFIDSITASWAGTSFSITNPGAESGTGSWTATTGSLVSDTADPHDGAKHFSGGANARTTVYQDVSLGVLIGNFPSQDYDMNPAHIIRECLTDRMWGMGYNDSDIDSVSFESAADVLHSEGFGLSFLWQHEEEVQEFISVVLSHIDAVLYVSTETGQFVLKLIRNDYVIADLPVVDEDDVVEWDECKHRQASEASNAISVVYWDEPKVQNGAATVHNIAANQQYGGTISTSRQYPGITYKELAIRTATRDLRSLGSGLADGRFTAKRTLEGLNPGDPFRLVSSLHNFTGEIMRVMEINRGDGRNNEITIRFAQDVFHLEVEVLVDDSSEDEEVITPDAAEPRFAIEMPYYELVLSTGATNTAALLVDPDFGAIFVAASRQTSTLVNAQLWVDPGTGYADASEVLTFSPSCSLDADLGALPTDVTVAVTDWLDILVTTVGDLALIGDEIVQVTAFDATSLTLARGCLDTVPQAHLTGAPVVIYGDSAVSDMETYTAGDTPSVKLLTRTGSDLLSLASAPANTVTMDSRAIRPYPVGRFKVDGNFDPPLVAGTASLTWTHRDRTGQTTVVPHDDVSYGPEAGVTYRVDITGIDVGGDPVAPDPFLTTNTGTTASYSWDIVGDAPPVGSVEARMVVTAVRDGYDSWQSPIIQTVLAAPGSAVGTAHGTGSASATATRTAASPGLAAGFGLAAAVGST